jgi:protein LTV1
MLLPPFRTTAQALLEYDSDDCGPLEDPEDDPTLQGKLGLDDEDISALMDEFLVVSAKDRILAHGGKGSKQDAAEDDEAAGDASNGGDEGVAERAAEEGPEEGEDSGNDSGIEDYMPDYFKAKEVSQWDCESIISTYSNLDNHPVRINEPKREPRSKKAAPSASSAEPAVADRESPKRIVLSAKSGMPVGVFPATQPQEPEGPGAEGALENKGTGRSKGESKEEKRARKSRVKEERQVTRVAKTQTKAVFKQEALDNQVLAARGGGGVAVFRY